MTVSLDTRSKVLQGKGCAEIPNGRKFDLHAIVRKTAFLKYFKDCIRETIFQQLVTFNC
jgi:hypothetical protein